ncbi:DUF87 domain-containing protein [Aerococcaceae bacterium DSM 111021]|nr:DUF87 domain-containing protein [Aerococcaceae bacterium DSM 111021]
MASKKKVQTKKSTQSSDHSKHYIYLIIGLIVAFISIIALFNWGFFGSLVLNTFRLFVGQAYDLLLVGVTFIGLAMVVKRSIINIPALKLFGALFILISMTTLLHFNQFYPQEPLPDSIFSVTFDIFSNEFVTGQNQVSIGGGMLGAVFYASFGYLFGQWGTYLLVGIVFFIGLLMITGATFEAFISALKQLFTYIFNGFKGAGRTISEARSTYKESFEQIDEEEAVVPDVDYEEPSIENNQTFDEYEDYPKEEVKYNSYKRPKRKGLLNKLKNKFNVDENDIKNEQWQQRYQPSIKVDNKHNWEEYDGSDALASTAASERARLERDIDLVLDLDYFDQINSQNENQSLNSDLPINNQQDFEVEEYTHSMWDSNSEKEKGIYDNLDGAVSAEYEEYQPEGFEVTDDINAQEINQSEVEETSINLSNAAHWQQQSNNVQNTTDNELDSVLAQSGQVSNTQTKKSNKSKHKGYKLPSKKLLTKIPPVDQSDEYKRINENIDKLERTFKSFGVDAKVVKANLGPSVTKYEIEPAIGVKVSKIVSLSDDIALALAARDIRMEAPIPGKSLIGIEVPNNQVSPVSFWEIVDAALKSPNLLEVPLGRDISGAVCTADLSKMPHLLIAGATGSGKSVGMNVIIASLLMKAKPNEVKFLMIDPKKVELTMYNELPHLLSPVVTNPRKAAQALNNVVQEMEHRYELFAASGVRNVDSYNEYVDEENKNEGTGYERLPKIVVFIDELADLMLVASNEVENSIIRLAQMARAAGIHMIIATQRPSVDVITGIIKANVPSRLAFAVSSGTDSRTILDSNGAEKLLGRGDMLFQPMGMNKPLRVQGGYISDAEVERITDFIKDQSEPEYDESIVVTEESLEQANASDDEYFDDAVTLIKEQETISISQLQRKFRIGYNRAARLIDDMEALGLVSEPDGSKPRQVLID